MRKFSGIRLEFVNSTEVGIDQIIPTELML